MFTGIIKKTGIIGLAAPKRGGMTLALEAKGLGADFKIGDSLAVNGVCLTLVRRNKEVFYFDAIPETLKRTTLKTLKSGQKVHLERPLKAGRRIDGHYVQGHVDGTGKIVEVRQKGGGVDLKISFPGRLRPYFFEKGSVAVDGVSLTLGKISKNTFWLHLVPHTLKYTHFGRLKIGTSVNLEADMLAKAFRDVRNG